MSEYGVAAHWRYKEKGGKGAESAFDKQIAWLREMVDWQDETKDSREFLKSLKTDLDPKEVYVFTPKGKAMSLRFRHSYGSGLPLCWREGQRFHCAAFL